VRFIDMRLLRSTGIGLVVLSLTTYALSGIVGSPFPPRSSLLIYCFIAFCYVVLSRFGASHLLRSQSTPRRKRLRVAIYGAGEAGFQLLTAMRASHTYVPMCFVDDSRHLHNKHISGVRVISLEKLRASREDLEIEQVILAIPSASPQRRRQIFNELTAFGLTVRTLPTMAELADHKISDHSVREIEVEDLLGRKPVPPRHELFAKCVTDKSVLVTGAGGSIGSELCRQIQMKTPRRLVLLDHSEFSLYAIERELREQFPQAQILAVLGSVCDQTLIATTLQRHGIQTVYHAAAYKHVPLVEANIQEGIQNNVRGTWSVALNAERFGVETCVLVSTDKAVRPTNVMGTSKRISELVFQAFAANPNGNTIYSMVRFGNVLGSSGSVVPLFRNQIKQGGPITLTHPDIIRYFMLIPEAAQLVIQAGAMARGGEVFVLDMGDPVRVIELARTMIEMSGLIERTLDQPEGDIEIRITGLRPGEKLFEELLIGGSVAPSKHPRIMCSHEAYLPRPELEEKLQALFASCKGDDELSVRQALQRLVPEYTPYSPLVAPQADAPASVFSTATTKASVLSPAAHYVSNGISVLQ
jgi:FlaA1/EpsC-like NDP-sugar epimerase